jgi:hypothetical protein
MPLEMYPSSKWTPDQCAETINKIGGVELDPNDPIDNLEVQECLEYCPTLSGEAREFLDWMFRDGEVK